VNVLLEVLAKAFKESRLDPVPSKCTVEIIPVDAVVFVEIAKMCVSFGVLSNILELYASDSVPQVFLGADTVEKLYPLLPKLVQ
jgi:hypothetical protein